MSTFTKRVVEDDHGYGTVDNWSSGYAYWGNDGSPLHAAMRFADVSIPHGSTINSAYITFTNFSEGSDTVLAKVYGIDEDNTSTMALNPLGRTKTTATIDWDVGSRIHDQSFTSPDIKSVVQEIVNREGWASGNAMGFFIWDDGSASESFVSAYGYYDDPDKAFYIEINYTDSASTTTNTSSSTSSTTTTSTTTSTSRTTLNHGIKVSKEGFDVESEKNLKNFIFHSARGVYGFRSIQEVAIVTNASGEASGELSHDFGYVPQCIVSVQNYDDIRVIVPNDWKYYRLNASKETIEGSESFTYQVDATKVYVQASVSEYNLDLDTTDYPNGQSYTFRVILLFNEISEEV